MSMAIIGGVVAAGSLAVGINGAVSGSGAPSQMSPEQFAAEVTGQINAQLASYPQLLKLAAAAQMGGKTLQNGYTSRQVSTDQNVQDAQAKVDHLTNLLAATPKTIAGQTGGDPRTPGVPSYGAPIANPTYASIQQQLTDATDALTSAQKAAPAGGTVTQYFDPQGNATTADKALVDFTGMGAADVAAKNADTTTASVLALERKYGPDLVNEQLALQKIANPEGVAAREQEYQDIMARQNKPVDTTMGQTLQDQLQSELNAGTKLDPQSQQQVEQAAREAQAARGNTIGNANEFAEAASVGQAGEARRAQHQGQALSFLTSGATPQDVNFRNDQQNIGNIASFLSGQTPQAQFSQLAGNSAISPTQTPPYQPPTLNPAAVNSTATSGALGLGGYNINAFNSGVNPWMQGLSTALGGLSGIGNSIKAFNSPTGSQAPIDTSGFGPNNSTFQQLPDSALNTVTGDFSTGH